VADIPEYITVTCSTCHTRLHPRSKHAGKKVICPDCGKKLPIPTIEEVLAEIEAARRYLPTPEEIGEYSLGEAVETAKPSTRFLEKQAEIKSEPPPPPPPKWFLISGVFTFPGHRDVILRWVFLSCGFSAVGVIPGLAWKLTEGVELVRWIVMAFAALPMIWMLIWSGSYAAACGLQVLEDTAAGNQSILEWPEPNWRDWAGQFFYVAYLVLMSAAPGYAIDKLLGGVPGYPGLATAASVWFAFPVCLLSSINSIFVWMPISWPIVRSLVTSWWCWLAFYFESALLGAAWLVPLVVGLEIAPVLTMSLNGPVLAAVCLIYARLLGRVAWHIGTKVPRPIEANVAESA
jgi:DNA-directed RNA polymerase subunit RPC12/RpoP